MSQPIIPVILCGGSGTRLWPLAARATPSNSSGSWASGAVPGLGAPAAGPGFRRPAGADQSDFRFIVGEQLAVGRDRPRRDPDRAGRTQHRPRGARRRALARPRRRRRRADAGGAVRSRGADAGGLPRRRRARRAARPGGQAGDLRHRARPSPRPAMAISSSNRPGLDAPPRDGSRALRREARRRRRRRRWSPAASTCGTAGSSCSRSRRSSRPS